MSRTEKYKRLKQMWQCRWQWYEAKSANLINTLCRVSEMWAYVRTTVMMRMMLIQVLASNQHTLLRTSLFLCICLPLQSGFVKKRKIYLMIWGDMRMRLPAQTNLHYFAHCTSFFPMIMMMMMIPTLASNQHTLLRTSLFVCICLTLINVFFSNC